jgi:hypothetical protein
VRGKYYLRYQQGTNVVLLDPDVAQAFKNSESVNRSLRRRVDLARQEVSSQSAPSGSGGSSPSISNAISPRSGDI